MVAYVPSRGDVIWLEFDPQAGREIPKTRPALVISPQSYNAKVGLALVMPITSRIKGYAFEALINIKHIDGAILCDQIRSLDWRVRHAHLVGHASQETMREVMAKLMVLL